MQALIKPTDLARRLGVSRTWLYDAAKEGRIPSIRVGGAEGPLRFVPDDIERWLDHARGDSPTGPFTPGVRRNSERPRQRAGSKGAGRPRASGGQQSLL